MYDTEIAIEDMPIERVTALAREFADDKTWLNGEKLRAIMRRLSDHIDPPLAEEGGKDAPLVELPMTQQPIVEPPLEKTVALSQQEPTHRGRVLALEKGAQDFDVKLIQAGDGSSWIDEHGHVYEGKYGYEATGAELRLDLDTVALIETQAKPHKRKRS